jgi:3-oxoadipate enol-lactonase
MNERGPVDSGQWSHFVRRQIVTKTSVLSIWIGGPEKGETVFLSHSILTNSAIWARQAALLVSRGFRVICQDTRGHGESMAPPGPYTIDDLVADTIAVLDELRIPRAHFVGVSLGGMVGFGLGVHHSDRLNSLCIVAARADAPAPFAAAWDNRIAVVEATGSVGDLARPTAERWFGVDFLESHPSVASALMECINKTSSRGFVGCARAIQELDYLTRIPSIPVRTSLVIGERDELLLQPMRDLAPIMLRAQLYEIAGAGHLPQIDRADLFDQTLLRHLGCVVAS